MYDDKKYSPCYTGYSPDLHLLYLICDIERSLQEGVTTYNFTDYYRECVNAYKQLTID